MGNGCSVDTYQLVNTPDNIKENIGTDKKVKMIAPIIKKKNNNEGIKNISDNINNTSEINRLNTRINSLERILNTTTMDFVRYKLDSIDSEKVYKKKILKVRKSNSRLWKTLMDVKHPEFTKRLQQVKK